MEVEGRIEAAEEKKERALLRDDRRFLAGEEHHAVSRRTIRRGADQGAVLQLSIRAANADHRPKYALGRPLKEIPLRVPMAHEFDRANMAIELGANDDPLTGSLCAIALGERREAVEALAPDDKRGAVELVEADRLLSDRGSDFPGLREVRPSVGVMRELDLM